MTSLSEAPSRVEGAFGEFLVEPRHEDSSVP